MKAECTIDGDVMWAGSHTGLLCKSLLCAESKSPCCFSHSAFGGCGSEATLPKSKKPPTTLSFLPITHPEGGGRSENKQQQTKDQSWGGESGGAAAGQLLCKIIAEEQFRTDVCLDLALGSCPPLNIVIWLENKQCAMGRRPVGPFGGSLMTLRGRGVVGVKADQRGCGARSQDRGHKSLLFSEEAIFYYFSPRPSELKYNHNRHIVLPPASKGYNSKWEVLAVDFLYEGQEGRGV